VPASPPTTTNVDQLLRDAEQTLFIKAFNNLLLNITAILTLPYLTICVMCILSTVVFYIYFTV